MQTVFEFVVVDMSKNIHSHGFIAPLSRKPELPRSVSDLLTLQYTISSHLFSALYIYTQHEVQCHVIDRIRASVYVTSPTYSPC